MVISALQTAYLLVLYRGISKHSEADLLPILCLEPSEVMLFSTDPLLSIISMRRYIS